MKAKYYKSQYHIGLLSWLYLSMAPPTSRCQLWAAVTLVHYYPRFILHASFPHLCLCFLNCLQVFSACPNLFHPSVTFPQATPSAKNAALPYPHSTPNNPISLNSVQGHPLELNIEESPGSPGRGKHSLLMTLCQCLLCYPTCGLLEGMDFALFLSVSPTAKQDLTNGMYPAMFHE